MTAAEINQEIVDYARKNLKNLPDCVEYDKMILCIPYNCFDPELELARNLSHERTLDYANIRLKDYDNDLVKHRAARLEYLRTIFGKIDKTSFVEPPFYVDYGCNIEIGKNFYSNFNVVFLDCTLIKFGDNVLVGPNVTFTTATHPTDPTDRINGIEYARPITVGNNVWFGSHSCVMPGVTIGNGAVIGASAVVNRDVPDNALVLGIPGRVVRIMEPGENKKVVKEMS